MNRVQRLILGLIFIPIMAKLINAGPVGAPVNIGELGSNPIDTNIGPATDGTMRVTLATDQPPIQVITSSSMTLVISTIAVTQAGKWVVDVGTGSITAFQGGMWTFTALPSTAPITVATGSITAFQGGPWSVGQSGSYTVTPGSGVWTIQSLPGQALPVIDTTTVLALSHVKVDTGTITAYQGGAWTVSAVVSTAPVVVDTGSITAFQGGAPWSFQNPSNQAIAVVSTGPITVNTHAVTQGTNPWNVSGGTFSIVNSTIAVSKFGSWSIDGGSVSVQNVAGTTLTISVANFPATQVVTQGSNPWNVNGGTFSIVNSTIAVSQFGPWSTSQSGSYTVTPGSGTWTVQAPAGQTIPVVDTTTAAGLSHVKVDTGTITAFQGSAPWNQYIINVTTIEYQACNTITISTFSVGTSTVQVLNADSNRVLTILTNEGSKDVRLGPTSITSTIGLLFPNGTISTLDGLRYFRSTLFAIAVAGTSKISVMTCSP